MLWVLGIAAYIIVGLVATYVCVRWFGLPQEIAPCIALCYPVLIPTLPFILLSEWVAKKAQR